MEALKLVPAFKDYIWGGVRLKNEYGKKCDLEKVAESWELSCHKDGNSVIANGEFAGLSLNEYIKRCGKDVLGEDCLKFDDFPILIKLIDAKDNLSVQVHPDNDYAMKNEGQFGKTEMWYVVDCDEGSGLLYGFKEKISKDEFKRRIDDGTLLDVVNRVNVKKGDVFFISSGTLHAIGKGILIAEIQQNSNVTYRIYDYGRLGNDGRPRELHIDKAVDVTRLEPARAYPETEPEKYGDCVKKLLASCDYFTVYSLKLDGDTEFDADKRSFNSLLVLDGEGELIGLEGKDRLSFKKGDSIFVPAGYGKYRLSGTSEIIFTMV